MGALNKQISTICYYYAYIERGVKNEMIKLFRKPTLPKNPLPIWLDDCYDDANNRYRLDLLAGWFKQIKAVDWGTDTATRLYISTRTPSISELIMVLNTFDTFFDPMDNIERNVSIPLSLPREAVARSYYEYFTNNEKMEFHPLRAASGLAVLLTRINDKLLASPERHVLSYRALIRPLVREIISVARALEIIYVIQ